MANDGVIDMSLDNEGRYFYDQDDERQDEPLRRSKTPSFTSELGENETLRRHQASDEKQNSILERIKKRNKQRDRSQVNEQDNFSRIEQNKRDKAEEDERKAQLLGKKLNKVIWILLGLIVLTYLIMRFINF